MTDTDWVACDSSCLSHYRYNAATQSLDVRFCGSARAYRYAGVSPSAYASFLAAPSKGVHLNTVIKLAHTCTPL